MGEAGYDHLNELEYEEDISNNTAEPMDIKDVIKIEETEIFDGTSHLKYENFTSIKLETEQLSTIENCDEYERGVDEHNEENDFPSHVISNEQSNGNGSCASEVVRFRMSTNKRKVSTDQLNLMVDFIKENRVMLHSKTKPTDAGAVEKLWEELSAILNSVGSGPKKNKNQWKKTFIDWKCKTRKKARENNVHQQQTDGGEAEGKNLTSAEEKLMSLISWVTLGGVDVEEQGITDVGVGSGASDLEGIPSTSATTITPSTEPSAVDHLDCRKRLKVSNNSTSLQKAAEAYVVGQKHSADILAKLLELSSATMDPQARELKKRELELKSIELNLKTDPEERLLRKREIELKEMELKLKLYELRLRERELEVLEAQQLNRT